MMGSKIYSVQSIDSGINYRLIKNIDTKKWHIELKLPNTNKYINTHAVVDSIDKFKAVLLEWNVKFTQK